VTRAGGAVGFTPDALERDIRAKAEAAIADVGAGRAHPLVLGEAADLGGAVDLARALGLEQLLLSTRGGTRLPEFYVKQGWTEVGVFPGALRLGPDDVRDEHWFQRQPAD
jgi:hypothetical protein